jgi:xanthine dehydrogenase YagS FAD-binding subunit
MVTAIEIPIAARPSAFLQLSEKAEFDWALVSCAVALELDHQVVRTARIALGAVAPVPYRREAAETAFVGQPVNDTTADRAAGLLLAEAEPLPQNAYKLPIARTLIRRALQQAASR